MILSLLSLLRIFMIISFKSLLARLLISTMLYFFLEFCLVPSSEIHFLLLSVYFYVFGINVINANDTTLMAESEEELNSLLMRVKEESEKAGLKLSFQKTKIMATSPITSSQIYGKNWKLWQICFSWLQNHCRWWLQEWNWKMLTAWDKSSDKPRQHFKTETSLCWQRVHMVKAMVFPVVMWANMRAGP